MGHGSTESSLSCRHLERLLVPSGQDFSRRVRLGTSVPSQVTYSDAASGEATILVQSASRAYVVIDLGERLARAVRADLLAAVETVDGPTI